MGVECDICFDYISLHEAEEDDGGNIVCGECRRKNKTDRAELAKFFCSDCAPMIKDYGLLESASIEGFEHRLTECRKCKKYAPKCGIKQLIVEGSVCPLCLHDIEVKLAKVECDDDCALCALAETA